MNNKQKYNGKINCGGPHFKELARQHRHANYTLEKVLNEFIDNIVKKANEIKIDIINDDNNRLQEIKISDNFQKGFENINDEGRYNPFNMGHVRLEHDDDNETSEFGIGLKAGSLSAANKLTVFTKVDGKYYQVVCDFRQMESEKDIYDSYNPKIKEISEYDYKELHPFEYGSTIILSQIRDSMCSNENEDNLIKRIKKHLSETYSRYFDKVQIFVNNSEVEKETDLFTYSKCKIFTIKKKLCLYRNGKEYKYILENKLEKKGIDKYKEFKKSDKKISNRYDDKWVTIKDIDIFKKDIKKMDMIMKEHKIFMLKQHSHII
jgi:hypothetical protein